MTVKDSRTGRELYHECAGGLLGGVLIAGWNSEAERIFECQSCHRCLMRNQLIILAEADTEEE